MTRSAFSRPGVRRDLNVDQAWPGGRIGLGSNIAYAQSKAKAFKATGSRRRYRACRSLALNRAVRHRIQPSGMDEFAERLGLVKEAEPFTEEFHARIARPGFDQWFRSQMAEPLQRPGKRTCWC